MMTPPNFALYFTCLFMANMAQTTCLKQSSLHFESADVGESVTLQCLCHDDVAVMFYWYKQTLGQKPKLVSTFYKHNNKGSFHDEFQNDPRFLLDAKNLTISHLQISDSATYYCVRSNVYDFEFCEGTTVTVKSSGSRFQALVYQSGSETIQPGDSVTLNCTVHTGSCDGEHSVYWFKDSEESHPGIIYTHGDRNDQCERKPDTQTNTCIYNLPLKNLTRTHAGTYYCAVATCGHLLFGNGTKVEFEEDPDHVVSVYLFGGALAFNSILVVLLAFIVYKMYKNNNKRTAPYTPNTELCQDEETLHYAALRDHKMNRSRKQRDERGAKECVYSSVK
ncbi:uncharacterized protein LOC113157241 [Anabas testudineus]|uniref:Ig-like domain-containing protein n=1 Tax=Anabas testudineus TaxID=64144 RepID=A0A3Q1J980_ANATE|nr:uncharacterized protein LOC113157241 [Anabas testudineus]